MKQIIATAKQTPYPITSCINSTTCSPYITDLDIRSGLQGALLGSPDFPAIFEAINSTLSGDASAFISPPPTVDSVDSMPLLCNDYGTLKLACSSRGDANAEGIDYPRTFEYFKKSLDDGLKVNQYLVQLFLLPRSNQEQQNDTSGIALTLTWQIQVHHSLIFSEHSAKYTISFLAQDGRSQYRKINA